MSYAVTDAVEDDMRKELKALESLAEEVDQLSANARDCVSLCPQAKDLLDLAWWFTQDAIADTRGAMDCGHARPAIGATRKPYCCTCNHFAELRAKAEMLRGRL